MVSRHLPAAWSFPALFGLTLLAAGCSPAETGSEINAEAERAPVALASAPPIADAERAARAWTQLSGAVLLWLDDAWSDLETRLAESRAAATELRRIPARLTTPPAALGRADRTVYFGLSSARLSPTAEAGLDVALAEIRRVAAAGAAVAIEIRGHADRAGAADRNHALSRARAETVRAALAARLDADTPHLFLISAMGETAPAIDTADGVAEPMNRRVEIRVRPLDQRAGLAPRRL